MEFLFLCIFLIVSVHGFSLFDLELKYMGIKTMLEKDHETIKQLNAEIAKDRETTRQLHLVITELKKDQETSRQLKSENIELKKELVNSQQRSGSLNNIEELIEKLAVVSSNLDMLKSGQETEKIERHGILADLGQIKQWTTNLIAKTERGWANALAKFTTENRDKQSNYEEFRKQSSDEWDQWRDKTNGTLSGIEAGCEETKTDLQRQQTHLERIIDFLKESSNSYCFKDCETGWLKDGCSCFSSLNNNLRTYDEAVNKCAESGARLIEPREITLDKFNGYTDMWTGVRSKDRGNHWSYQNGTEAKGLDISKKFLLLLKKTCALAEVYRGKFALLSWPCDRFSHGICVKS